MTAAITRSRQSGKRWAARNDLLAKIHIAKKQLGLDYDTYRDLLERVTGKRSAAELNRGELVKVVNEMKARGFVAVKGSRKPSDGERTYLPKLNALWLSGYHLGVVDDISEAAMLAFVKRQTGLDHTRFLRRAADAAKAIEGLKAWLAREAHVEWKRYGNPREAVARAQWDILRTAGLVHSTAPFDLVEPVSTDEAWHRVIKSLGDKIRSNLGPALS